MDEINWLTGISRSTALPQWFVESCLAPIRVEASKGR